MIESKLIDYLESERVRHSALKTFHTGTLAFHEAAYHQGQVHAYEKVLAAIARFIAEVPK